MRFALWTVAIAAAAVGLALLLRQSDGYVVIVSAPWRVELSLTLLVVAVLAGYLAFHALLQFSVWVARIPARVRERRAERARAAARKSLNDSLLAFFQGRYASAERAAAAAMADAESRGVAAIVAARSAHELGRFAEREAFLGQATGAAAIDEARLTTLADLLNSQGKHEEALAVAGELLAADPRNTRALRLLLAARDPAGAQAIVETSLEQAWDPALVALYADCASDSALPLIERAEAWLPDHARDAVLLLTLGKLCTRQALWGKAQGYLEASLSLQPSPEAHRALADLLERLGKPQEAGRHLRKSAELAR